jgi:WD40 repeat protein
MSDENYYKIGGSLEYQHPTYVVRQADYELYEGLTNGDFCYVLNSRQMGKSSLRVQMMKKLKEQGFKCASIDMTRIGSYVTPAEWYAGIISELLRGFSLTRKVNFSDWWREREMLPPLQRLSEFIEDVLLAEFSQNLVIFIDEIDSIIKINFKEDFFAFIRACYNQRVDNPEYNRLTFCLLGVATPSDLIGDKNISTPFNIGRAIELTGFHLHEVQSLIQGLEGRVTHSSFIMQEILEWTGGQPFLTQKLCKLIVQKSEARNRDTQENLENTKSYILKGRKNEYVERLVRSRIIENWETQDEPEHLRTIRDRILWSQRKGQLLQLYQQILQTGEVKANDKPEQMELRLSGLVVKQQGKLRVYNRIYESIFNQSWVENALVEAGLLPEVAEKPAPFKVDIQALEQIALDALQQFEYQQIEALVLAMQAGQKLKALVEDGCPLQNYPTVTPLLALQTILNKICERNQFKGHNDMVYDVCFSPKGQHIATVGSDGTVRLWNLFGQQLAGWQGHQGKIDDVSFSPDGQLIATAGRDGTAKLWNLSGQLIAQFNERQTWARSVSFSADGQLMIVTAGTKGTAKLWNLSGQQIAQFDGHQGRVWGVSFSPDGQLIATAAQDGTARLWNLSGQQIARFNGHQGTVWGVSFSPNGQLIATAGADATAKVWDLSGQQLAQMNAHQDWVYSVSFSPDEKCLATAGYDGTVSLWKLSGQQLAQLNAHVGVALGVSFSPDGQRLATAGSDGMIRLWDLSEKHLAQWKGHQGSVWSVSFSPSGQLIATAGRDSTARLWDLSGHQLVQLDGHPSEVTSVSFCSDEQRLATAGLDGKVILWDLSGRQLAQWKGHQGGIWRVSFSPDGQRLGTAGWNGKARLWDLSGQQQAQLNCHQGLVRSVSFSPDGQHIATAGDDGAARLWNLAGQQMAQWQGHQGGVNSVSFSPDGQQIATAGDDGTVRLWQLFGHQLAQWKGHQGAVLSASFSPDGQRIATAGWDGTVRLWELSGRQLAQWNGHRGRVLSVCFSPDNQCIATTGDDGIVRLWQIEELDELLSRGWEWLEDYLPQKHGLTPREQDIWLLYRTNYSYKQIANELNISLNTVKKHMKNIYAKLHDLHGLRFKSLEASWNLAGVDDVEDATLASSSSEPIVCDRLSSERGIDYTRLHDLLAAGQWLEADLETTTVMLRVSGREAEGWLRAEDMNNFPCMDLLTIDQLWVKYSKGRFGFSVQKKIWESLGGKQNAEYKIYRSFSKSVGWSDGSNSWLHYPDLSFNSTAVVGHLPGGLLDWLWSSYRNSRLSLLAERAAGADGATTHAPVWWNIIPSIASRLSECDIQ